MYQPIGQPKKPNVSLSTIDSAFDDINANSIELTKLLAAFGQEPSISLAQNILTQANILIGYMISLRNQLVLFKRESSLAGNATAKDYLNELKVQMDGLKSIVYSHSTIYSALQESNKLNQKLQ